MNLEDVRLTFKMVAYLLDNRDQMDRDRFNEYRRAVRGNLEKIRKELYRRSKRREKAEPISEEIVAESKEMIENWKEI